MKKFICIVFCFFSTDLFSLPYSYAASLIFAAEGCIITIATNHITTLEKEVFKLLKNDEEESKRSEITQQIIRWKTIRENSISVAFLAQIGLPFYYKAKDIKRLFMQRRRPVVRTGYVNPPVYAAPPLVASPISDLSSYVLQALERYGKPEHCLVCFNHDTEFNPADWTVASISCLHLLCKECKRETIRTQNTPKCPTCRGRMD